MARWRLNFMVSSDLKDKLESLQARAGGLTMTEVLRRALALYECAVEVEGEGGEMLIRKDGQIERVVML